MGAQATVLGASGYSGGELLRLLDGHPAIELAAAAGGARTGERVADVHPHLAASDVRLDPVDEVVALPADVCFSCLPSGELAQRAGALAARLVVDLSDDFRGDDEWVYGLTEFARDSVAGASKIANPGCYPTGALLCLLPFARAGLIGDTVVIDALSGVSGAGRKAEDRLLFGSLAGSAAAYGTTSHRHIPEIERGLQRFGDLNSTVSFTPHLIPVARGLLVTARARPTRALDDSKVFSVLSDAYSSEPFVDVIPEWPAIKSVCGTNRAHVSARMDTHGGWLVCSAAIDNLGKGAAGQALQNANLALGLDEATGLSALGVWP